MTNSADSSFVDAVLDEATRKAAGTPGVRGANFRYVTVTGINTDGTVSIGDIRARRHQNYTEPLTGDQIVIMQSGNRNWIALGRLAAGDDSGGWTNLTLASTYNNPGHGYTASWMREGKRIWLRGHIGRTSGTIANAATIATIPAAIRPAGGTHWSWAAARDSNVYPAVIRLEITDLGALRTYQTTTLPDWVSLDGCTYTTD